MARAEGLRLHRGRAAWPGLRPGRAGQDVQGGMAGGEAGQTVSAWAPSILSPPLPLVNAALTPWTLPALTGCGFISHALKPRNNEYNIGLFTHQVGESLD